MTADRAWRIALVTMADNTELRSDGPFLTAALAAAGIDSEPVPWGANVDWESYDAALIRASADYVDRREEFLHWAEAVARRTRLANPHPVLAWNTDKRYLRDLEQAGVAVVPTVWAGPDDPVTSDTIADARRQSGGEGHIVVKPVVSAGARLAARYGPGETTALAALDHVRSLQQAGHGVMIQPYLDTVDLRGETGTYVFGGSVSHAIAKGAVLRAGHPPPRDFSLALDQRAVAAPVDPALVAFAGEVLEALPFEEPVLYARVDTVTGDDGRPLLLELELTEPFLFLETDPPAAERFAAAVRAWLRISAGPLSQGRTSGRPRS